VSKSLTNNKNTDNISDGANIQKRKEKIILKTGKGG